MDDLKIARAAVRVAYSRERQHTLVGRRENRVEQIELRVALVDVGADQRRAPARRRRQRQHVIDLNQPVAHAMCRSEIRPAVLQCMRCRLAEPGRTIRWQRAQGNVPAIVVDPLLDVAAAMCDGKRAAVVAQQHDVVRQPAETAEHDVLIARQILARAQRRLPFALQNRDVGKHLGVQFFGGFLRRFLGRNHDLPHCTLSIPATSNAAGFKAL